MPVAAAAQSQPGASAPDPLVTSENAEEEFDLNLDSVQDIGIAWPDLDADEAPADASANASENDAETNAASSSPAPDATEPTDDEPVEAEVATAGQEEIADDGSEHRYRIILNGLDQIEDALFRDRFRSLSLLEQGRGKPANIAQINRRMRMDAELLEKILRAKGYYDAVIRPSVRPPEGGEGESGRLQVIFNVRPGVRYALSDVSLPGLGVAAAHAPTLRTAFPIEVGTPVDADAIMAARSELALALGENGFPFAKVEEPVVTIDHDVQKGDLEVVVRPGGYRLFGEVVLENPTSRLMSASHLMRIARFDRGDVYKASDIADLRRAIVATGLVSSVDVKPQDSTDGSHVDVSVAMTPAKVRTIAAEIGYGTGEGYRLEASWQHRNFFPPEGGITVRGLIGTKEQGGGVAYRRNNFLRRDHILSAGLAARHQEFDAYKASTIALTASIERQTNILYQKKWAWSIGTELVATREKGTFGLTKAIIERDYLIAALPASVIYDASDDLLNPTSGFRLGARLSPELSRQGGATLSYLRAQVDGSIYLPISDNLVVASRIRLGTILGAADPQDIAPSRRFYAGGGASVRGYAYQAIGPRDANNDPVGGKSLAEFSLEARVRLGVFGVVPFIDAGNISTGFLPEADEVRVGAGVGLRYYSNFGPIRIDLGTPVNPQRGDSRIAVYVSLGQAF